MLVRGWNLPRLWIEGARFDNFAGAYPENCLLLVMTGQSVADFRAAHKCADGYHVSR